ncbi:carbohydrate ABC transporter permease [Actinopolymorpha alba]|uniref:carbohydrate ABC transporter permease n=1 Tax=Actinopolymorpha alba TaxID=533267 RepID=UPI00036E63D6|nr:sugar ABC transporter permease [Actinopolymorpha alba]
MLLWYPTFSTIWHSFTDWNGATGTWIGLANYADALLGGQFFELFRTNLVFLCSIPPLLLLCVVVAVAIYDRVPGWRVFRSVYYLPTVLSAAVVGLLMRILFSPDGAVNGVMNAIGLGSLAQDWLGQTVTAFAVLLTAFYWQTLGQGVVIFLAGLSTIGPELIEASKVDGAGWWRRLFFVVLPQLLPTVAYFLLTNVIYVLVDLFGLVFVSTGGGPGRSTTPIDYMIYLTAFQEGRLGAASALAVLLLVIAFTCSWFQVRLIERLGR